MSTTSTNNNAPSSSWGVLFAGGIATSMAGMFMLVFPVAASVSVTMFAGWMLIFMGVFGCVGALTHRDGGGRITGLIMGIIAVVAGVMLAFNPLAGTLTLTMIIVLWLIIDGLAGIVLSLFRRGQGWGWWLLSSLFSLALGLILLETMPLGAAWIIGTYVGIVMLIRGMTLTAIAFEVRRLAKAS